MSFLKAEWRKLAIFNYEVDPSLLEKHIPFGTELDLWQGRCYISLVGFMFVNTKVLGIGVPFHKDFEEVNLRFYVKRFVNGEWRRGVVFIKEIVPKTAITLVANTLYNENYETMPMEHTWEETEDSLSAVYKWKKGGKWQSVQVKGDRPAQNLQPDSETEFITEHYWGYARYNESKSIEYEVTHPKWKIYEVSGYDVSVDYKLVYGQEFEFLNTAEPASVMFAEGSEITVESKQTLE
ncbi:DUF2071 domain-containing protein [Cytophagaceae bacterium ABcell3]|nr:DUF2071 domain-containing protein [Cytophagaceae bacterium ABcell3]